MQEDKDYRAVDAAWRANSSKGDVDALFSRLAKFITETGKVSISTLMGPREAREYPGIESAELTFSNLLVELYNRPQNTTYQRALSKFILELREELKRATARRDMDQLTKVASAILGRRRLRGVLGFNAHIHRVATVVANNTSWTLPWPMDSKKITVPGWPDSTEIQAVRDTVAALQAVKRYPSSYTERLVAELNKVSGELTAPPPPPRKAPRPSWYPYALDKTRSVLKASSHKPSPGKAKRKVRFPYAPLLAKYEVEGHMKPAASSVSRHAEAEEQRRKESDAKKMEEAWEESPLWYTGGRTGWNYK